MRLRKRKRQIASAVAVVTVAAVVVVVVVVNGIGINGCVVSASAPEVHVLPGQGRQRWLRQPQRRGLPPGTAAASEQPHGC